MGQDMRDSRTSSDPKDCRVASNVDGGPIWTIQIGWDIDSFRALDHVIQLPGEA
jgi:hypothetical protein